ncbi:hypothetical protein WJX72_007146 [[Myrmecia] bisecta]|uniref:Intraflagellar transport protein 172 n=1 Tax=[Myrmecia] bisecta TaxID=41462 RepID=A0AAW1R8E0_9CHLO
MQLRHLKAALPPVEGVQQVTAIAWSPNNQKLAAVTTDRVVYLFDENGDKKDKFKTKAGDSNGAQNYVVRGMAFSPDSTKLAIAQSDNIVFVYRLGLDWVEKKSICNKFLHSAPVTCLTWPLERPQEVVFAGADGKVRVGVLKSNKAFTLYEHPDASYTVSLAASKDGQAVVSGHLDGSIYRFQFDDSGASAGHGKLAHHPCPPYGLAWAGHVVAAGNDCKVVFYGQDGQVQQQFDYSSDPASREFTTACFNPSGDACVVGSFNRLTVFSYNARRGAWEEIGVKQVANLYSVTALDWKPDGSKLAVGNLTGCVDLYDACTRRHRYKGMFEFTYVSRSQAIVKRLSNGMRIVLKSAYGSEIDKINVYQDRFLVAHTPETLLLGDLETCKLSEVPWNGSGQEKFVFDNPQVCMVYNAGELTLIEYGHNDVLGACRTEHMSSFLISVQLTPARGNVAESKRIAFLIDLQTVRIMDLVTGAALATVGHDVKLDWLELNSRGTHLLFRDRKHQLHLYSLAKQERTTLLSYCTYVQWVPSSDVVVAQNRSNLCVWYNIDHPDRQTVVAIKGEVETIERSKGRTEVLVDEGVGQVSYALDETLIDFGAALEERDYERAVDTLEPLELTPETEAQWQQLAEQALEDQQLAVAQRCYAALGNLGKARYLQQVSQLAATSATGVDDYMVRAKLAVLSKQWGVAESLMLAQGKVDEAIRMYTEAHKWDEAIKVAEKSNHPEAESLKRTHYAWLLETGQEEAAGAVREKQGDLLGAISLYLKGGMPAKAAQVALSNRGIHLDQALLDSICNALVQGGQDERAGDLYDLQRRFAEAKAAYQRGNAYRKAVDLARREFPGEVVALEEAWGDWLMSQRQVDAAINHFIEAGQTLKAIEAALAAKQWAKAATLIESQDRRTAIPYYKRIAAEFEAGRNLEEAERYHVKAGTPQEAVEMYMRAGKWEAAHKVAMGFLTDDEVHVLYTRRARELEAQGNLREAERMYVTVKEHDLAINMYKQHRLYDQMVRLVGLYRRDLLGETHLHLAQQLESEGNLKDAEGHYIDAKEWKAAVQMYRSSELWSDAMRVAKTCGGVNASKQVAYAWAVALGGEEGAQLLSKFGLVEQAIDYALESGAFGHAFELAQASARGKLPEVHLKYAMYLEDEGRFGEAEVEFLKADKPQEAIDMYVHCQEWAGALRVAQQHAPSSLPDIIAAQGHLAAEHKEWGDAEALFLKARQPELALRMYRLAQRWPDALRIAQDYLPARVQEIHQEMQSASDPAAPKGPDALLAKAKTLERNREWSRAIDAYLAVTEADTQDMDFLEEVWENAVKLAMNNKRERITAVVDTVSQRLIAIGRHEAAAELLQGIDDLQGAARVYIMGGLTSKAQALAAADPSLRQYVEEASARQSRQSSHSAGGRPASGASAGGQPIEAFAQQGDWDRVYELAEQAGPDTVARYAVRHAKMKAQQGDFGEAAGVLARKGAPPDPANFDLYRHIARGVLALPLDRESGPAEASCAEYLHRLVEAPAIAADARALKDFTNLWEACHYSALRRKSQAAGWHEMAAKQATAVLRHVGDVPADKAFYEAGLAWKAAGRFSMAFVFLNRYLDLTEAMDEDDEGVIENADFAETDIPFDFHLPERHYASEERREEVRDWVLAISMDQSVEQELSKRPCGQCGKATYEAAVTCHACHAKSEACAVTGYPVPPAERVVVKGAKGAVASRQDWNQYVARFKVCPVTGTPQAPIH